jgi:hypothetical protein
VIAPLVLSCLVEHLDGAAAAVDPGPVAGAQAHGAMAASDDGGMPENSLGRK